MDISASFRARAREVAAWPGWRRHAPAAGSAVFHLVAAALVAATLGVASGSQPITEPEEFIAIELVNLPPEQVAMPEAGVTPPRAPAPRPAATDMPSPSAPAIPDPRKRPQQPGTGAPPAPGGEPDSDSVYIPPSVMTGPGPAGLQGLAKGDPCTNRYGPKPKDCPSDLAARVGPMDSVLPRSKDDLAQHFADYMPTCPYRVGCEPGERRTLTGAHAVDNNGEDAGGAASLGGLHDSVGRLGFNPDHTDPGFGD